MARYTITPWKLPSDLLAVRQQLYRHHNGPDPDPADLRRRAVDRIMAWKLRSNLPHAVESTALLIDAQLHHQNASSATNSPGPSISEFSIRAVYAAAFTRFVTGFCDIGRAKERGLEQSSMLAIARQIGMPPEFVALRHEATHEELPGLRRLVGAVEKGLEWLWTVYWAKLEEPAAVVAEGSVEDEVRGEVARTLKGFRRERRDALRSRAKESNELIKRTREECLALCPSKRTAAAIVAGVLVDERLLLPTNRRLGESMDGAYMIWDDMLTKLNCRVPTLPNALIDALFSSITKSTDLRPQDDTDKEAHALWIIHLTRKLAREETNGAMQLCCLHPGHWTNFIGRRLLEQGSAALRETWEDIFSASFLGSSGPRLDASPEKEMQQLGLDQMEVDGEVQPEGKWRKATVPPFLPIGVVG